MKKKPEHTNICLACWKTIKGGTEERHKKECPVLKKIIDTGGDVE